MNDEFAREVLLRLKGKISEEYLKEVYDTILYVSANYEISKSCTDIVEYEYEIPECFTVFMVSKRMDGRMSDKSSRQYYYTITDMLNTIRLPVEEIKINHIRRYIAYISKNKTTGEQISRSTLNQRKSIIRSFFQWLFQEGYIDEDPSIRIHPERCSREPEDVFTDFQVETMRKAVETKRDLAILDLLLSSGMRISELLSINISDVNFDNRSIVVLGKGCKYRTVYFDARALSSIIDYLSCRDDTNTALFVSLRAPHNRLSCSACRSMMSKLSEATGISGIHPHRFRHTMATTAVSKGCDIYTVQKLLGHSRIETTSIYAHVSDDDIRMKHKLYIG